MLADLTRWRRRQLLRVITVALAGAAAWPVQALPTAPGTVCRTVPEAAECAGSLPTCTMCHVSTEPPQWNAFGMALKQRIAGQPDFSSALVTALQAIESEDADGDGVSNRDELLKGTPPGAAAPRSADATPGPTGKNPRFRLDGYDPAFALRRTMVLYCGRSPSYEENQAFKQAPNDDVALRQRIHDQLAQCLESEYWQQEGLPRLADKRIRPLTAAGPDSQISIAERRLVIGDYGYDYRLWRYVLSQDRDMRELLTAQYHVVAREDGKLEQVTGVLEKADPGALAGGQLVEPERRAGMLTTQWFLAINTMFSALPRTTAAQAYRSYLGADISSSQGLRPVEGEPLDIDQKGVSEARCANCHSTLDPLSYAFAEYEGIQVSAELKFGAYRPERIAEQLPGWDATNQKSVLLGQPVANVVEWGRVAAASDEFKRNMTSMFYRHALGRDAIETEQEAFQALWRSLPEDGYSANKLLHRLVDSQMFGGP